MEILNGRRILILEEQPEIAALLAGMVSSVGCEVIGPARDIGEALDLISGVAIDAAILDVTIKGEVNFALADELLRKGTPYAFASGNITLKSIERYAPAPIITKPYSQESILQVLRELIDTAR